MVFSNFGFSLFLREGVGAFSPALKEFIDNRKVGKTERIDDRRITHLVCVRLKHLLYDFWGGVLGLLLVVFLHKRTKTPLKSHMANVLGGHRLDE